MEEKVNIKNSYEKNIAFLSQNEVYKIIFIYRFISLMVTTVFFLFNDSNGSVSNKLFIITCISLTAIILTYLYIKNHECEKKIRLLVTIETIGNTLILIPSGGVNSPYVWYSLNTLLIASLMLNRKYVWINLFIYLFGSTGAFIAIFQPLNIYSEYFLSNMDFILSLLLITYAIQLLARLNKKIIEKNDKLFETNELLTDANKKIKSSIEHIMELYQAVELFSTLQNKGKVIEQLLQCSEKITRSKIVLFYDLLENQLIVNKKDNPDDTVEGLQAELLEIKERILDSLGPVEVILRNRQYLLVTVKSNYLNYGIFGIEANFQKNSNEFKDIFEQVHFLSTLCSIILEKFELKQVNEGLLISEEQNRIANEIHDRVLQRLFSISCGIYSIKQNGKNLNSEQLSLELDVIRDSINNTMKDLRTVIYSLSWAKGGKDNFKSDIAKYINEIKKLNNVEIKLNFVRNEELLTTIQRNAFYRIICEGISNAIRHGRASYIELVLYINGEETFLNIMDNGCGFNKEDVNKKDCGLGLKNIRSLVDTLNGNIIIESKIGKGTSIEISIPNGGNYKRGELHEGTSSG